VNLSGHLISTGLALLAFVVAFYVLLARERKTPYIINFIFRPAGVLLLGILLAFVADLLHVEGAPPAPGTASSLAVPSATETRVAASAVICFSLGLLLTLFNIWRLHNRQVHFRDDHRIRNTLAYRWVKRKIRQWKDTPTYAQTLVPLDAAQIRKALVASGLEPVISEGDLPLQTVAICGRPLRATDQPLAKLCVELINSGWYVQYTTCIRHPWAFTDILLSSLGATRSEFVKRIVVVDAYTPHFGFTDSVHEDKTVQVKKSGVNYVAARESYAGVHTGAARGFNMLKALDKATRRPTLVIYEGAAALSDLESTEQYRVFARHVLSSERMWGGMLTMFVEPAIGSTEIDLLLTYADLFFARIEVKSG